MIPRKIHPFSSRFCYTVKNAAASSPKSVRKDHPWKSSISATPPPTTGSSDTRANASSSDTGYPEAWPSFTRRLAKAGLTPGDIDWLFLTHAHDDHAGFVNELFAASDCTAVASASALKGLRRGQNGPGGGAPDADALAQCLWMVQQGHGAHRFPALAPGYEDRFLWVDDATRPDIEARLGLAILPTPGHTGDSLSLLTPEGDLFCGDAAQNGRPTHGKNHHLDRGPGHLHPQLGGHPGP